MATIAPRNPILGIVRLIALFWTLLSLLGFGLGVLAVAYAGAWGCVGHALGWFGCTAASLVIPLGAAVSLFTAGVVLFFSHLFYVAGARSEEVRKRKRTWREKSVGVVLEVVTDIFD
jgi:hypothetical protein